MKYFIDAIKYGFKNSIKTSVFVLLPAIFMGYFVTPFCLTNFLNVYPKLIVNSYEDIFKGFFDFSWQNILLTTIGCVLAVFIITLLLAYIERHMRTNKFTIEDSAQIFNGNILVVGLYLLLIVVIYMVCMILLSLMIFLLHLIVSGVGNTPNTFNLVLTYALSIIGILIFFYGVMYLFLAVPETISTGYSLSTCVSEIGDKFGKNKFSAYIAFVLPLLIHFPVLVLSVGHWWYPIVLFVLMYMYIIYYTSLVYVIYFDISGFARKDIDSNQLLFRRK